MKFVIPIALILTLVFGLPFREHDTAKLLPIQSLQAEVKDGRVRLVSEAGEGVGENFLQAVENLRKKAAGDVFFDTTEHLLLCDARLLPQILASGLLRPAAQVYFVSQLQEQEGLSDYLAAHPSNLTLASLQSMGRGGYHPPANTYIIMYKEE